MSDYWDGRSRRGRASELASVKPTAGAAGLQQQAGLAVRGARLERGRGGVGVRVSAAAMRGLRAAPAALGAERGGVEGSAH